VRARLAKDLLRVSSMANPKTRPYWLDGGTETCELCEHTHHLQAQRRCAACDRASCEHCVTVDRETGEVLCHECAAEEKESG
jgi:hypothetical protein